MEEDAEIHSKALGRASRVQLKRGREGLYEQWWFKIMMRKPIETADLSLWELTDSGPTAGELAWE